MRVEGYDEVDVATPELVESVMRTIRVPSGYRYVDPVSCLAGADIRIARKGAQWTRVWPSVNRRVNSRCAPSQLPALERTGWFPCSD